MEKPDVRAGTCTWRSVGSCRPTAHTETMHAAGWEEEVLDLQIRAGQGTSMKTFELFKPLRSPDLASLNTYRHVCSCVGPGTTPGTRTVCDGWNWTRHTFIYFLLSMRRLITNPFVQRLKNAPASICMDRDKGALNMFDLTSLIQTMQKKSWETSEELSCTR